MNYAEGRPGFAFSVVSFLADYDQGKSIFKFRKNSPPFEGGQGDVSLVMDSLLSYVKLSPVLWNIPLPPSQGGLR